MIRASDYASLPLAVAAAESANDALELTGGVVYNVSSELRIGTGNGAIRYIEGRGAIIRATASMRSVIAVIGNQMQMRDVRIECQRLATHGIYTDTSSRSSYENVDVYQALSDGFAVSHDNDFSTFRRCSARMCGTIWHTSGYAGPSAANLRTLVTGTCTVSGGSAYGRVVTFSNLSVPLTSMGLRRGDWISVDPVAPGHEGAMFWAPILQVDSASQLTLDFHPFFPGVGTPCQFSIHKGHGFHFGPGRADNNCHYLETCLAENTGCNGFYLGGLYGSSAVNCQVNAAGAHPVVVGGYASDRNVFGTEIRRFYTENGLNGASSHVYCDGAVGILITTVNGSYEVGVSNPSLNRGVIINNQNLSDATRMIDPIGAYPQSRVSEGTRAGNGRSITATIPTGQSKVAVTLAGCTADAFIIPMVRDNSGGRALWLESVSVAPGAGSFEIRTTGPVSRPVAVDCYVVSL